MGVMMIKIVRTSDMDERFDILKSFCKLAYDSTTNKSLRKNMDYKNWKKKKDSLLYKAYINKTFHKENGSMVFVYNDKELISVSGVERFRYEPEHVALIGSRYYILKKPKGVTNFFHEYIWPQQINWCLENNIKLGIMRFNSYNEKLFLIFNRILKKQGTILGRKNPSLYQKIKLVPYPKKLLIEFTPQNVVFCYFDKNFNWTIPEEIKIKGAKNDNSKTS
jgi:hypothetical protein